MANELSVTGSITFNDTDETASVIALNVNMTGTRFTHFRQSVAMSEEALILGELSGATLGWCYIKNLDSTNYVEVRSGTGSSNDIIKIKAGEFALFRWGSDVTAPYAIANTAAVLIEARIYEA
jgi:hypothetical protein